MPKAATSRSSLHIVHGHDGDNVSGDGDTLSYSQAGGKQTFQGDSYAWS